MATDDGEHGVSDEDEAHRQHRLDVFVEEPQRDNNEKPSEVVGVRHRRGAQLRRHKDAIARRDARGRGSRPARRRAGPLRARLGRHLGRRAGAAAPSWGHRLDHLRHPNVLRKGHIRRAVGLGRAGRLGYARLPRDDAAVVVHLDETVTSLALEPREVERQPLLEWLEVEPWRHEEHAVDLVEERTRCNGHLVVLGPHGEVDSEVGEHAGHVDPQTDGRRLEAAREFVLPQLLLRHEMPLERDRVVDDPPHHHVALGLVGLERILAAADLALEERLRQLLDGCIHVPIGRVVVLLEPGEVLVDEVARERV